MPYMIKYRFGCSSYFELFKINLMHIDDDY